MKTFSFIDANGKRGVVVMDAILGFVRPLALGANLSGNEYGVILLAGGPPLVAKETVEQLEIRLNECEADPTHY